MSNTIDRLLNFAVEQSQKSTVNYKHGSVIFKGKKPICFGYNANNRTQYKKNLVCCLHAEMSALIKFLNSYIKIHNTKSNPHKLRRKLKKYSICVARSIERADGSIECQNSSPCKDCLSKLLNVGLNKICYTTGFENPVYYDKIKKMKLDDRPYSQVMGLPEVIALQKTYSLLK
jgi:deoxycytidylate deaminase